MKNLQNKLDQNKQKQEAWKFILEQLEEKINTLSTSIKNERNKLKTLTTSIKNERNKLKTLTMKQIKRLCIEFSPLLLFITLQNLIQAYPKHLLLFNSFMNDHWFLPFEFNMNVISITTIIYVLVTYQSIKGIFSSYRPAKKIVKTSLTEYQQMYIDALYDYQMKKDIMYEYQEELKLVKEQLALQKQPATHLAKLNQIAIKKQKLRRIKQNLENQKQIEAINRELLNQELKTNEASSVIRKQLKK